MCLSTSSHAFFWDALFEGAVKGTMKSAGKQGMRRITKFEKMLVESGHMKNVKGKRVAQRNQTFNKNSRDAKGRSNCERIIKGNAPIGHDGMPIQLHHMKQQNDGVIVELMATEHRQDFAVLHRYINTSEIDRKAWNTWRSSYWQERAKDICH